MFFFQSLGGKRCEFGFSDIVQLFELLLVLKSLYSNKDIAEYGKFQKSTNIPQYLETCLSGLGVSHVRRSVPSIRNLTL